ncbi:MAG: transglutaminase domain-containing protein [Mogibacterium sp.]|nr:transglutaminase domain-containing protein [Mogibacterium sp.]
MSPQTGTDNRIHRESWRRFAAICCILALLLTSCGAGSGTGAETGSDNSSGAEEITVAAADSGTESKGGYQPPDMKTSAFHEDRAEAGLIDLSCVSHGYVAVSATSDARLKFQVLKDDMTYNYDLASDGTPSVFPLQCGDGTYTFRIMENVVDTKYAEYYSTYENVVLDNEFEPFLRPSDYVNYNKNSACVAKAAEFSAEAETKLDVVASVYRFVTKSIKYDKEKADNIQSGYLPDPDETMNTGRGICFDSASLAAAMLRSQGIPTKVVFGYVSPDDVYHAWNMFYTEETGWVTAKFAVDQNTWNRIDLTFAASGTSEKYIGDGSNYADVYYY